MDRTIGRVGKWAGAIVAVGAIVGFVWSQVGGGSDSPPTVNVDGDVTGCVMVGDGNECTFPDPTADQTKWLEAQRLDGPPNGWRLMEDWDAIEATVFPDGAAIELEPSQQLESGRVAPVEGGFQLEISDTRTVTEWAPNWTGPWRPPFYAAVTVTQSGGPVNSRACGLLFNGNPYGSEAPNDRWLIAKVAGGDVAITQWTPTGEDGTINHRKYEELVDVIPADGTFRVEVLVTEKDWTVAIDDRIIGTRAAALGEQWVFPAGQQETTARVGNVVCSFFGWELWQP